MRPVLLGLAVLSLMALAAVEAAGFGVALGDPARGLGVALPGEDLAADDDDEIQAVSALASGVARTERLAPSRALLCFSSLVVPPLTPPPSLL